MPYFQYVARNMKGKEIIGKIAVENEVALYRHLKSEELFCVHYKEILPRNGMGQQRMKLKSLVIFAKQFSTMLNAGVPVVKCLDIVYNQTSDKKMKKYIFEIYEGIQKGNTLSNAFKQQGDLFPPLFVNLLRAGEESGNLDIVLERLSVHYEKEKELKDKTLNAMIYPIILSFVSFIVMGILLVYVIPNFFEMFQTGIDDLPMSTKFLMGLSEVVRSYGHYILAAIGGIIAALYLVKDLSPVKRLREYTSLNLPVLGKLNAIILSSRFAQTLSTLYASGLSLLESLEITQDVLGNDLLNPKLDLMRENISKGMPLSTAIAQVEAFPTMLSNMIEVGEESGRLDEMLDKTAVFYEQEADVAIKRIIAIMEPAMIVLLGTLVGFIVAALIPPIYSMYQNMS